MGYSREPPLALIIWPVTHVIRSEKSSNVCNISRLPPSAERRESSGELLAFLRSQRFCIHIRIDEPWRDSIHGVWVFNTFLAISFIARK